MPTVSREDFLKILNERLVKHKRGKGLPEFTNTPGGYTWPRRDIDADVDSVYIDVAKEVEREYMAK